jgi:hypothetical protein
MIAAELAMIDITKSMGAPTEPHEVRKTRQRGRKSADEGGESGDGDALHARWTAPLRRWRAAHQV